MIGRRVAMAGLIMLVLGLATGCDIHFAQPFLVNGDWRLRNTNSAGAPNVSFRFGSNGQIPVAGDWNGDGTDTVGTFDPAVRTWHLRNSNTTGGASIPAFVFGPTTTATVDRYPGRYPVAGDWNGDGIDTIGIFDRTTATWYLRNSNTTGGSIGPFVYGKPGDLPIVGDWNGDGKDTIGIIRGIQDQGTRWALRNSNTAGNANLAFLYGTAPFPAPGDWNGDGIDTPGAYEVLAYRWQLRNSNSAGRPNIGPFAYTGGILESAVPIVGDWNGDGKDTIARAR